MSEWVLFLAIIILLLCFDLGFLSKNKSRMSFKKSLLLSLFYFVIACFFGFYIKMHFGGERTKEYFTGFLLEKAMSLDNIFVISLIFRFFHIPEIYQYRVLFWGILGVVVFRAIMIGFGAVIISNFSFILYFFAVILIYTGIKIFYVSDKSLDVKNLYIYKYLQRHLRISDNLHGEKFFIKLKGQIYATPLFISLIIIEAMDLVFAIDSIPAIFAITNEPYIVYTSNIFAILGLRALFFCLADIVERFKYMKYSLSLILIFIGLKIFISHFIKIPTHISLSITIILLLSGILVSLVRA